MKDINEVLVNFPNLEEFLEPLKYSKSNLNGMLLSVLDSMD